MEVRIEPAEKDTVLHINTILHEIQTIHDAGTAFSQRIT